MPKKSESPKPSKRFVSGAWVILWRYSPAAGLYKQYTVSTGMTEKKADELAADILLRRFAVALAQTPPEFPSEYAATSGVRRYLEDRYGAESVGAMGESVQNPNDWLTDYKKIIFKEVVEDWAKTSLSILKKLDEFVPGGIGATTAVHAHNFLESILMRGRKPGTRNRALAACSRFFGWCLKSGRAAANPFSGIGNMTEEDIEEIVYCTKQERDRIIACARALGRPDWIAVPIALYAGCRREEIFVRLGWEDVNIENRRMTVLAQKTKKKKKRITPLAKELVEILAVARQDKGTVVPAIDNGTWENQADRLVEMLRPAGKPEQGRRCGRSHRETAVCHDGNRIARPSKKDGKNGGGYFQKTGWASERKIDSPA